MVGHVPSGLAALVSLRRSGPARWLTTLWVAALFYVVVFSMLANTRLEDPLHIMVQERSGSRRWWSRPLMGVGLAESPAGCRPCAPRRPMAPAIALPVAPVVTEAAP